MNEFVTCLICGIKKKRLARHLVYVHNLTVEEYKKLYDGAETTAKSSLILMSINNCSKNEQVNAKRKATCSIKYGGPAPACSKEVYEKAKDTHETKFGTRSIGWAKSSILKRKQTNLKNCGYECNLHTDEVKSIARAAVLKNIEHSNGYIKCKHFDTKPEMMFEEYLNECGLVFEKHYLKQKAISNISVVDFFIPILNLCIFIDGDYWHANPQVYSENWVNHVTKKTAKQIHEYDANKTSNLEDLGYVVSRIYEKDIADGSFKQKLKITR